MVSEMILRQERVRVCITQGELLRKEKIQLEKKMTTSLVRSNYGHGEIRGLAINGSGFEIRLHKLISTQCVFCIFGSDFQLWVRMLRTPPGPCQD